MKKAYMGIDIGSISTKAVIIDEEQNIILSKYLWTEGNPIKAVTTILNYFKNNIKKDIKIVGVGTTGSARRLIGSILKATVIKNEITAHAVGTLSLYPDINTIIEIGGQDSKIILIRDGIVVDYAMNTLCAAGTGAFLSSQAKRLGIDVENFGKIATSSSNPTPIAARCTVFAESDLVHKAQMGYDKKDIIAGLCRSIALNFLNNVAKEKKIISPVIFQGGVSKNIGVKKSFEDILGIDVITDDNGHLMGALGVAILSMREKECLFSFDITDNNFTTTNSFCGKCPNNCEIIVIKKDNQLIDAWGNRCPKGEIVKNL